MRVHCRFAAVALIGAALLATIVPAEASTTGPETDSPPRVEEEPAVAMEVTEQQISVASATRASLGLNSDPAYIRDLLTAPERFGAVVAGSSLDYLGLTVTPDEAALIRSRRVLEGPVVDVQIAGSASEAEVFGGAYIRTLEQGRSDIVVNVTGGASDRQIRDLVAVVPLDLQSRVAVVRVRYSERQLIDESERLHEAFDNAGIEYVATSPDVPGNQVVVVGSATGQLLELAQRSPVPVRFEEPGTDLPLGLLKTDALAYALVIGAQGIKKANSANQWDCTSGFAAHGAYGPFIVTADHCSTSGTTWYQGGAVMGTTAGESYSYDAEAITTYGYRNQSGRIHLNYNQMYEPVDYLTVGDSAGVSVCNGGTSISANGVYGPACGTIVYTNVCRAGRSCTYRRANFAAATGDSGGSVYTSGTYYGRAAQGLISSCVSANGTTCSTPYQVYYSYLPSVLSNFGLTLDSP